MFKLLKTGVWNRYPHVTNCEGAITRIFRRVTWRFGSLAIKIYSNCIISEVNVLITYEDVSGRVNLSYVVQYVAVRWQAYDCVTGALRLEIIKIINIYQIEYTLPFTYKYVHKFCKNAHR